MLCEQCFVVCVCSTECGQVNLFFANYVHLVYFAVFVYSKVYAKPSYSRDEFFALINFKGKVNYQFASRKSGMFHNGHSFVSLFLANQRRIYNVAKLLAFNVDRNRSLC